MAAVPEYLGHDLDLRPLHGPAGSHRRRDEAAAGGAAGGSRPRPVLVLMPGGGLGALPPAAGQRAPGGVARGVEERQGSPRRASAGQRAGAVGARIALRRWLTAAATVGALAGLWFGAGALRAAGTPRPVRLPGTVAVAGGFRYVVQPGDTLWGIATRVEPGADPRPLVDALSRQLRGAVAEPGEVLLLP